MKKKPIFYRVARTYVKLISKHEAITFCSLPDREFISHIHMKDKICEEWKSWHNEKVRIALTEIDEKKFIENMNLVFNKLKTI